jgi:ER membrane protein complex subunit 3
MAEDLVLDTAIRDWVLVPLSVVMVLIGVLRYFVSKLMRSPVPSTPLDPKNVKEGCVLCSSSPLSIPSRSATRFALSGRAI